MDGGCRRWEIGDGSRMTIVADMKFRKDEDDGCLPTVVERWWQSLPCSTRERDEAERSGEGLVSIVLLNRWQQLRWGFPARRNTGRGMAARVTGDGNGTGRRRRRMGKGRRKRGRRLSGGKLEKKEGVQKPSRCRQAGCIWFFDR